MREIKFRGKAKMSIEELNDMYFEHDNGWFYGNLVMYGDTPYIVGDFVEVDQEYTVNEFWVAVHPESVGQFTSLKDKNGTEIYEGDVVQYLKHKRIYHDYENESAYVEYNESKCRFELNKGKGNNETFCSFSKFGTDDEQVEVIGNIYEHPHLLK